MIAMIDLGLGNLGSVACAFARLGREVAVVSTPAALQRAGALILPGVGAFGEGMARIRQKGLFEPIRRAALDDGKPLLGICLGLQLLAETGEELGSHAGLGLIPGRVVRLHPRGTGDRVPNIGWHRVAPTKESVLFAALPDGGDFYFVHSFHLVPNDAGLVSATIDYGGEPVTAAVEKGAVCGVQFHPEKSQDDGLEILSAFETLAAGHGA